MELGINPKLKVTLDLFSTVNNFKFIVTKKKQQSGSLQQKLQNEVTKEIRKNIEDQARGFANKFGETTKMDRKKK